MTVEKIRELDPSPFINLLVYGDPGVGKTRLAGTSPGKVLIIRPPIEHTDSIRPEDRERVREWVIRDWEEMNEALEFLRSDGGKFDWVWLDSISLIQDVLLDDIWANVIAEKPHRARYGLDKAEYGTNMHRLGLWIRHVVGARLFNFGITAHTRELPFSDDPDEDEKLMPWIQGKQMPQKVCGYMNVVSFLGQTSKGSRVLYTSSTDRYYAKDQYDALGGKMLSPTIPKIEAAIAVKRTSTTTTKKRRSTRASKLVDKEQ